MMRKQTSLKKLLSMQNVAPVDKVPQPLRSLYLLQNAVINYSGGASELLKRTQQCAEQLDEEDALTHELLKDISVYLKDISTLAKQQ